MLAAAAASASHPVVAGLLGLVAAGLAGGVVAMAWNVNARQIRLAEQLARRQFIAAGEAGEPGHTVADRAGLEAPAAEAGEAGEATSTGSAPLVVIDGPDTVITGDQVRYRLRTSGSGKVVSWAAGGGSVSQCPDPAHPDELLLIADQPGDLVVTVRVREGFTERRATKSVTAVPDVTAAEPPFTLRLFLHGWGLVVVAVLVVGFAGALDALGNLTSSDFIALVAPLAALLAVIAVARAAGDASGRPAARSRPARGFRSGMSSRFGDDAGLVNISRPANSSRPVDDSRSVNGSRPANGSRPGHGSPPGHDEGTRWSG
jgi:hypothetical protein